MSRVQVRALLLRSLKNVDMTDADHYSITTCIMQCDLYYTWDRRKRPDLLVRCPDLLVRCPDLLVWCPDLIVRCPD